VGEPLWQRRRGIAADVASEDEHSRPHVEPSETVGAAVQRTKGDRRALKHTDLPLLQGAVGNRVMAGMLAVQRHSVRDAPARPVPEEQDDESVQTLRQGEPTVQRWDKGIGTKAKDLAKAPVIGSKRPPVEPKTPWARPTGPKQPGGAKTKIGTRMPILGAVAFSKPQLDADGASTGKALVPSAPARKVAWSIEGDAAGSKIDDQGIITAGNDLKGKESAKVDVKATDVVSPGAQAVGTFELWQPGLLAAKKELDQFLAKGPYTHKDFMTENRFGKFDASYDPSARLLSIGMRIKFLFPDDKNTIFTGKKARLEREKRHADYQKDFIDQVTTAWSGKFAFENVREPKSVWARLNPVQVALNVTPTDKADGHFLLNANMKTEGTANVSSRQVTTMYKGSDKKAEVFTDANVIGELSRVKKAAPDVFFKKNKAELTDASLPAISFLATYLRRLNYPSFEIGVVGYAPGSTLAAERGAAAAAAVKNAGLAGPHVLTPAGRKDKAAGSKASFEPKVEAGYKNQQDVTAHEFGHMLGLDDEYDVGGNKGKGIETYDRVKTALGGKWADLTNLAGIDSESVMDGGSDVRIHHYITLWDVLGKLTTKKAPVPIPKFGDADWKFVG
jgi:hypothetical protein